LRLPLRRRLKTVLSFRYFLFPTYFRLMRSARVRTGGTPVPQISIWVCLWRYRGFRGVASGWVLGDIGVSVV